ncbi:Crp/Fnr family transcriptional regulator [Falsibacillus albus]|nr:Crp/Fnr family transcriptional regulator [Falsibacillus albus]
MDTPKYPNTNIFSDRTFEHIKAFMSLHTYQKDSFLFLEQELSDNLYYVEEGQIRMTKTTEDGKEMVLYLFQKGDLFGELGVIGETQHRFNAKALRDSKVATITQRDVESIILNHGDAAIEFVRWMGLMNQLIHTKLRDLLLYGKIGALCSTLIRLSNSFGDSGENGVKISKKMTNGELADLINTSRETVNRMLSDFKKNGIIEYSRDGEIIILDMEHLKKQCHCEGCPIEICRI